MKPLKIEMYAFGTYKDLVEIDFQELGLSGLYLVAGDTGSGKTSIFDAITFALYGSASGSIRNSIGSNSLALRSDYANDNEDSYVNLTFLHRGEIYKIKRTTARRILKARSQEYKTESEKVELIRPDNKILTDKNEVNEEIKNLLGIDKNQFCQIVMLAQGEFQQLLNSNTKQREEIFRKLFSTDMYLKFQVKLSDKYKEIKANVEKKKNDILLYISQIQSDNINLINLLKSDKSVYQIKQILEFLETENKNDKNELKKLEQNIIDRKKTLDKKNNIAGANKILFNNKKKLDELENDFPQIEKEKEEIEKEFNSAKKNEPKIQQLAVEIGSIKKEIESYNELNNLNDEYNKIQSQQQEALKDYNEKTNNFENKLNEFDKNKEELKKYDNISVEIEKNRQNIEKNSVKEQLLRDIEQKYNDILLKNSKLEEKLKLKDELKLNARNKLDEFTFIQKQYYDAQAGILAKNLKEKTPCPVCGSMVHPNPAKLNNDDISKENVDKAQDEFNKANDEFDSQKTKTDNLNTEIATNKDNLINDSKKIFKNIEFDYMTELLKRELNKNEKEKNSLKDIEKDLNKKNGIKIDLKKRIQDFEHNKKTFEEQKNQAHEKFLKLKGDLAQKKVEIDSIKKYLKYKDGIEANAVLKEKTSEKEAIEKRINDITSKKDLVSKKYAEAKSQIDTLKDSLKDKVIIDSGKLDNEIKELNIDIDELNNNHEIINSKLINNINLYKNIEKNNIDFIEHNNIYDEYKNLSETASAGINGKNKTSFEQYIQTAFLDMVLDAANIRFKKFSLNQFELRRKTELTNSGQQSLDLNVLDYYTGKERSVKSLSGGESFKAALSLSLGLSDVIQNQTGAIQIDAMFIDEGFGSLDSESLEQALNLLALLSDNDRMIGIISHVSELRDRIDRKIIVNKTNKGSVVRIEK